VGSSSLSLLGGLTDLRLGVFSSMLRSGSVTTSSGVALGLFLLGTGLLFGRGGGLAFDLDVRSGSFTFLGGLADFGFGVFGGVLGDGGVATGSGIGGGAGGLVGLGSRSVGRRGVGAVTDRQTRPRSRMVKTHAAFSSLASSFSDSLVVSYLSA